MRTETGKRGQGREEKKRGQAGERGRDEIGIVVIYKLSHVRGHQKEADNGARVLPSSLQGNNKAKWEKLTPESMSV